MQYFHHPLALNTRPFSEGEQNGVSNGGHHGKDPAFGLDVTF